jgi:hypothetical protein
VKTDELIVQLARSLAPVSPIASPRVRLMRWTALSLGLAVLGIAAIGPRADVMSAIRQDAFVALAALLLATAVSSAASALTLSIPGAERSPAQRAAPVVLGLAWAATLVAMLAAGGAPVARLLAFPVHAACAIEIAAFAAIPAWALFGMLHRAAPLAVTWSAGLAALAAAALGAVATQIVCPLDDPAHHLAGHLLPLVAFTIGVAAATRDTLAWRPTIRS